MKKDFSGKEVRQGMLRKGRQGIARRKKGQNALDFRTAWREIRAPGYGIKAIRT